MFIANRTLAKVNVPLQSDINSDGFLVRAWVTLSAEGIRSGAPLPAAEPAEPGGGHAICEDKAASSGSRRPHGRWKGGFTSSPLCPSAAHTAQSSTAARLTGMFWLNF